MLRPRLSNLGAVELATQRQRLGTDDPGSDLGIRHLRKAITRRFDQSNSWQVMSDHRTTPWRGDHSIQRLTLTVAW